jgi:CubicO group peptidase (beta-lactamase class C family)
MPDKKVTPETLFFTASTTKSFTSAAMSMIINDERRSSLQEKATNAAPISWTTPLASIIPEDFVLPDPYVSSHVTIEDALSHRTGMPDHECSFGSTARTVKGAVRSLRNLPLSAEIRTKFMYNNIMFTAVSHVIETIEGKPLGQTLKERIWVPLGMSQTYWTPEEAIAASKSRQLQLASGYAWSYERNDYVLEERPNFPSVSGSGAMISNVLDYAKWLRCMMKKSEPLSLADHEAVTYPRTIYSNHGTNIYPPPHLYALGWIIDCYRGEKILWHGGGWTGFGSVMAFLPERRWGFTMMGNTTATSNGVQIALYSRLLDDLLEVPQHERIDWGSRLLALREQKRRDYANSLEQLYPRLPDQLKPTSLPLEKYTGKYSHPSYDDLVLKVHGKSLLADRQQQEIAMDIIFHHVSGEYWLATLHVRNQDIRDCKVVRAEFRISVDGKAKRVGLELEPLMNGEKIWFERKEG